MQKLSQHNFNSIGHGKCLSFEFQQIPKDKIKKVIKMFYPKKV